MLMVALLFMGAVTQVAAISPTGIQLNQTSLTLNRGAAVVVEAQVTPDGADTQFLQWTSSNTNVVRVLPEADGNRARVEGVAQGTAVVTVSLPDGSLGATCQVTVRVPVTGVAVSETTLTLLRGQEAEVTATLQPGDATNKRIRWKIGDEQVLEFTSGSPGSFGSHGTLRVRGVAAGTTSLTVTTEDGSKQAVTQVTVIVPLEAIAFELRELSIPLGDTAAVPVILNPLDTTSRQLQYESADPRVVKVDETGLITAVGGGTTRVVVRSADEQEIFDSLQVTVSGEGAASGETALPPESQTPAPGTEPGTTPDASGTSGTSEGVESADSSQNDQGSEAAEKTSTKPPVILLALVVVLAVAVVAVLLVLGKKKSRRAGKVSQVPASSPKHAPQGVPPVPDTLPADDFQEPAVNLTRRMPPPVSITSGKRVLVTGVAGEFQGHTLELAADVLVIGRDPLFAHLVYPGSFEMISRKHVVIEHEEATGKCSLRDLSSTGTFLQENHQRLPHDEPVYVKDGQRFYLAVTGELFEIHYDQDPDSPASG